MIQIDEKNHASVIIGSLNKIYNKAKLSGKLEAVDLYILNMIYDILNNCFLELTKIQKEQLITIYRSVYFHSINICNINSIETYKSIYKSPFFQAESTDCNDYPIADKIYYWQENNTNTTIENIILLIDDQGYFLNKPFDTKEAFYIGKNIDYVNIGKICFAITEAVETDTYKIYDSLNNDVTHTFTRVFIDSINTILFVSQNTYSHGIMFFKFKKTIDIFDNGIFNNIFNNTFN